MCQHLLEGFSTIPVAGCPVATPEKESAHSLYSILYPSNIIGEPINTHLLASLLTFLLLANPPPSPRTHAPTALSATRSSISQPQARLSVPSLSSLERRSSIARSPSSLLASRRRAQRRVKVLRVEERDNLEVRVVAADNLDEAVAVDVAAEVVALAQDVL